MPQPNTLTPASDRQPETQPLSQAAAATLSRFHTERRRYCLLFTGLSLLLLCLALSSVMIGQFVITFNDLKDILRGNTELAMSAHILLNVRIPRVLLAILVGASLALGGATIQAVLRNPLASPDVLGTASASGFGAALGILFFADRLALISLSSFTLGMVSLLLVFSLCRRRGDQSLLSVILSGLIISSVFTSLIALSKYIADPEGTLPAITFWLMGNFQAATYRQIGIMLPIFLLAAPTILCFRWRLNLLSLGDSEALMSGINPRRTRMIMLTLTTLLVAATVTTAGIVGWVGLVMPHLTRRLCGDNHGYLLPLTMLNGAVFMLLTDTLARTLTAAEIPVGILTSMIGAPLFAVLFLLRRNDRQVRGLKGANRTS